MTTFRKFLLQLPVVAAILAQPARSLAAGPYVWTLVPNVPPQANLLGVKSSGDLLVAVGRQGAILRSADGQSWTAVTSGTSADLRSVAWSGRTWVAVGAQGTILTSADGISWTAVASPATEQLVRVIWDGSAFVASGQGAAGLPGSMPYGLVLKSADGVTWSYARTTGTYSYIADLVWDGRQYVGVGPPTGTPTVVVYLSPDAVNWTYKEFNRGTVVDFLQAIAWNGSRYVAGGSMGFAATSSDATSWTVVKAFAVSRINGVASNSAGFVAVGGNGLRAPTIFTTVDGQTWNPEESPSVANLNGIDRFGDGFVAVGEAGVIVRGQTSGPVLSLTNDNADDDGSYTVTATLSGSGSYTLTLIENQSAVASQPVTLVAGAPPAVVTWSFDGKRIGTFDYRAELTGALGTVSAFTSMTVNGGPKPVAAHGKVEAEKMTLTGYKVENNAFASGRKCVAVAVQGGAGTASFTYDGVAGTFTIRIGYFDENDGQSSYGLYVNGSWRDYWTADKATSSPLPNRSTFTTRVVTGQALKTGDVVEVHATQAGGEQGRLDYIEVR